MCMYSKVAEGYTCFLEVVLRVARRPTNKHQCVAGLRIRLCYYASISERTAPRELCSRTSEPVYKLDVALQNLRILKIVDSLD